MIQRTLWLFLVLSIPGLVLGVSEAAAAENFRLAGIFADHMVLQREQSVPVWGWANPGKAVRVAFAGQSLTTTAGQDGIWLVTFQPLEATAAGRSLTATCGKQSLVVQDVLVGELWHASGQSNMAMTVGAMVRELSPVESDIRTAELPALRFCRINAGELARPLDDLPSGANWTVCTPATVTGFSGVAFYFARQLHQELGVPIGIIDTSRGGTPIEPFIPRSAFTGHPTLERELQLGDQENLEALWKLPGGVRARDTNWLPGRLFHSRLAPLRRFAVRGAIWYQGESNCGDGEDPRDYQHKLRALIRGWRAEFDHKNLPVYVVQLPGSGAGPGWPYLREQQRLAMDLPHTGLVVTLDIDGAGIHPANKIDVGQRLARWALAKDYGRPIPYSGPLFERQEIQGDQVILHFRHAERGLMPATKDGLAEPRETPDATLAHFEVSDQTGTWHPSTAKIVGQTVVVTSPQVLSPVAARYAYAVSPENCQLYNRNGLPACPFCSRPELLTYEPKLP